VAGYFPGSLRDAGRGGQWHGPGAAGLFPAPAPAGLFAFEQADEDQHNDEQRLNDEKGRDVLPARAEEIERVPDQGRQKNTQPCQQQGRPQPQP
jgi:hypothetical protein